MKKNRIIALLLLIIFTLPLFAGEWYEGRTINNIETTGLINVKENAIREITKDYVGQVFTDELYSELEASFYSQSWLSYFLCYPLEVEGDETSLVLSFEIYENPIINSIKLDGNNKIKDTSILNNLTLKEGGFYSSNNLGENARLIKAQYIEKGYIDVNVSYQLEENEEKNSIDIIFTISEGKQYKIRSISFENNNAIETKELKNLLTSKEKSFFNSGNYIESTLNTDLSTIVAYYSTKGYPDAKISEVRKNIIDEDSTDTTAYYQIVIVIDEGEEWRIGDITVSGNTVFDTETLLSTNITSGTLYNNERINNLFNSIASLYYDNGYVYSNIDISLIRKENNTIDVNFIITEGPQTVIEEIRINGLTKTKPYVLERELDFKVGDVFSRSSFIQSQQNMYNTSLLKNITANLYPGNTENGVICEFEVEEGNQMELQFGATFGANEIDGFPVSGFLSLSNTNLGGTARHLSLSTELSPTTQSLSVSLSDNWVGDKRWSNAFSFSISRNVRQNILQRGTGSSYYDGRDDKKETYPLGYNSAYEWYNAGQKTPGASKLMKYDSYSFSIGYNSGYSWVFTPGTLSLSGGINIGLNRAVYDNTKYDPYEVLVKNYNDRWQFSNKLMFSINWDGRNYVDAIPHGYVLSSTLTYAGGILGGLSNYNKFTLSASVYRGVFKFENEEAGTDKDVIVGLSSDINFMIGQLWNKNNDGWKYYDAKDGATRYEMLYIDGMNIGRGFSVITDQAFLWNNQLDITYPVAEDVLSLEGFVSATAIQEDLNKLNSLNWYYAAGIGIKMEIPGFPLGLYLVKNATNLSGEGFKWTKGSLFSNGSDTSGLKLVLAITTSIY